MQIRRYAPGDTETLWQLVFNTVHKINSRDYTPEQVNAWIPKEMDKSWWENEFSDKLPFILYDENSVYGYADVQRNGHINHFFISSSCQREGKGTALLNKLIHHAIGMGLKEVTVEASITAKPFFEYHGFIVVREEKEAQLRGQVFHVYFMKRIL